MDDNISADVNILSQYLSRPDVTSLSSVGQVDCIVLCVSSVLYSAQTVFDTLVRQPSLTKTLVLCGGLGHSTELVHKAVALHPTFKSIAAEICGLPEAQVLHAIWNSFYASQVDDPSAAPRILIEDRSTTCATNASEARKLLEASAPRTIVVIQDPTMVRRTVACFDRVYMDMAQPPTILGCPIFVPRVKRSGGGTSGQLAYESPPVNEALMWKMDRFLQLVMGEIPRLRDDEYGYGPKGNGSIVHVDIPDEVEQAYTRLAGKIAHRR
ncbi:hypothetical protein GE21DRAFT_5466 [Neurospora crassa]|uniref:DUF218 domain-containing protein n=1 Tax=Neurospora crassa (strain ATCC 24698 / 74-OR23-1A / CBS 708.71 / DSM 1257 / FGSC 987) TaxID=367110 RepID=Q7S9X5_NEUCR|nr:DUF218 domain-containing protein [Neurospora crassa OR74A]EAA33223.1 DUF218 domain-containing protein [Neurospora crassa OR74A]KHE85903.1 hypothetical protein GE21DRAFT_5466 [Neurospora crassa]|eukprot:XP_962459.1 DUF218 domain-containing protein [Neurospora crassa OR74A]